jgi:proprotein convertase subtilisin/kexin type 5
MNRYLSGSFCKCSNGFYDDTINENCTPCQYSCKLCNNGLVCLSCDSLSNRVYNSITQLCNCKLGYYEDPVSKICLKCQYTCSDCVDSSTCSSCNAIYGRNLNNNQCLCTNIGQFDNLALLLCQQCSFRCENCLKVSTNCTTCSNTSFRSYSANTCNCVTGYFEYNSQAIC